MFLVDMLLMCCTSYIDKMGIEITNSNFIIIRYVSSFRFLCDFGAVLGTGFITSNNPTFKIFGFFKMIRILRLGGLISRLNVQEEFKALLKLVKFTIYLFVYLHVLGCTWWAVIF